MSEYSEAEFGYLHVLRHGFRPSDSLAAELGGMLKSGGVPDFLLRSTKEAYVDSWNYAHDAYASQVSHLRESAEKAAGVPFEMAHVVLRAFDRRRALSTGEVRATPMVQFAFNLAGERFQAFEAELDVLPDRFPRTEPARHYLTLEIPRAHLRDNAGIPDATGERGVLWSAQGESKDALRRQEALRKGLFSAIVSGLTHSETSKPADLLREDWRNAPQDAA